MSQLPTTNKLDRISASERRELVGFCEVCIEFKFFTQAEDYDFFDNPNKCVCGNKYSNRTNYQITTQRSHDSDKAKKQVAEFRKIVQKRLR